MNRSNAFKRCTSHPATKLGGGGGEGQEDGGEEDNDDDDDGDEEQEGCWRAII